MFVMKKVFLVGTGGIGVSALAKYLKESGYQLFGSDATCNENTKELIKNYDLKFFLGHNESSLKEDIDFLIYSPAILELNPERKKASALNIKQYSYPEFLGEISEKKFTISVSGTNGKTTTSTMISEILIEHKKDPTIILGGISKKFNSNFKSGKDNLFLVESCEFKKSFLNIKPNIIIITNITLDHLDYF